MSAVVITDKSGNTINATNYSGQYINEPPTLLGVMNSKVGLDHLSNLEFYDDDVLICSYPRSGFHWFWENINMIVHGGKNISDVVSHDVFLEYSSDLESLRRPRVMATHLPLRLLPKAALNKARIVVLYRNPKDVSYSLFRMIRDVKEFGYEGNFSDFMYLFIEGKAPYGSWWEHVIDYGQLARNNGLCVASYEQMTGNPAGTLERLSKYLGSKVENGRVDEIANACNFNNMKKNKVLSPYSFDSKNKEENSFIRKGKVGDWKNHYTVAMNEDFDKKFQEQMQNQKIDVTFSI